MTPEDKALWVNALRSGEYKQGQYRLTTVTDEGEERDCCLGVACKVFGAKREVIEVENDITGGVSKSVRYEGMGSYLPMSLAVRLNTEPDPYIEIGEPREGSFASRTAALSDFNDRYDLTFSQIADLIEYFL